MVGFCRKRVLGLETEYASVLVKSDGRCFVPNDVADCLLVPVDKFFRFTFLDRPQLLRDLKMMRGSHKEYWLGATGGKLYGDIIGLQGDEVLEYATPECDAVEGVVRADKAGDRIVNLLRVLVFSEPEGHRYRGQTIKEILISKNNSDLARGGFSWSANFLGSHENYGIGKRLLFGDGGDGPEKKIFVRSLASLLIARQLLAGSGGLCRNEGGTWRYVISPRALIAKKVFSRNILSDFPLVSYRETAGDPEETIRLHISMSDSNQVSWAIRFRFGLVCIFLAMFEEMSFKKSDLPLLSDSPQALKIFSCDPTLCARVDLENKRGRWTLPELLRAWLEILVKFAETSPSEFSEELDILCEAGHLVDFLPQNLEVPTDKIEWQSKLCLLQKYCAKQGIGFSHPKARRFDIYYADISPQGLYNLSLKKSGEENIFSDTELQEFIFNHRVAPRAELRKRYFSALAENDLGCHGHDWSNFFLPSGERIDIVDPFIGTEPRIEEVIQRLSNQ